MKDFFATVNGIGKLSYREIYGFYEVPLMFSCTTQAGGLFVLLRLTSDNTPAWLAVDISSTQLNKLERNEIELRSIYLKPENGYVYRIYGTSDPLEAEILMPEKLTEDMLPFEGEYLDYNGENDIETSDKRSIIEVSLEKDDSHEKQISTKALIDMLDCIQMLVYSLAYNEKSTLRSIPDSIREQFTLVVTDTFAASFGIRFKTPAPNGEEAQKNCDEMLSRLDLLLSSMGSMETVEKVFDSLGSSAISSYHKMLLALKRHNMGIGIQAVSPTYRCALKHLSTMQVTETLKEIRKGIKRIKREEEYKGTLVGINCSSKKFVFETEIDGDKKRISGTICDELKNNCFYIPNTCTIRVEMKISLDETTGKEGYQYQLIGLF